ncbi:RNase H family protein [Isoptericola jiangsuensis]|uniref:RNase H family protein n=1 Tax=Isoptericola jiangsuensis TaxID=548579 RepID=UPI003AB0EA01
MIIVSTDGTGLHDTGDAIGWAWVAHGSGRIDSGGATLGTAQVAELVALREAVEAHPGDEPLFVESTSQYAIRCASEWLETWKDNGWRTPSGGAVQHLAELQALDAAIADRSGPVRFRWVRGHVDSPFTQRARELAGLAAQDWAAGRGDLEGTLLAADDGGTQDDRTREAVGARAGRADPPTSGPNWELGTLFD